MLEKELLTLLLQDFPESIIITYVCFRLLDLPLKWKKVTIIGLLEALTNLVRLLPIAFGMHTLILPITLALYIRFFTSLKFSRIFIAVAICLVVIVISEGIYYKPMLGLLELEYEEVITSPFLKAFFSIPEYLILLLVPTIREMFYGLRKNLMKK